MYAEDLKEANSRSEDNDVTIIAGGIAGGIVGMLIILTTIAVLIYWYTTSHSPFQKQGCCHQKPEGTETVVYDEVTSMQPEIKTNENSAYGQRLDIRENVAYGVVTH